MPDKSKIDNPDIIPYALYNLGGIGSFIDVEDMFLKCFELAPARFSWRKHSLPNYKILSKALRDFEGAHPDALLKTADGLGRQLTAEGVEWVRSRLALYEALLETPGASPPKKRPGQRLLNEIEDHPLYGEFAMGLRPDLAKHQVADLLMCAPDSPSALWRERLESYRASARAANREAIVTFLNYIAQEHPEWFGGGHLEKG